MHFYIKSVSVPVFQRSLCKKVFDEGRREHGRKVRMSRMYGEGKLQALGSRSEDVVKKDTLS